MGDQGREDEARTGAGDDDAPRGGSATVGLGKGEGGLGVLEEIFALGLGKEAVVRAEEGPFPAEAGLTIVVGKLCFAGTS